VDWAQDRVPLAGPRERCNKPLGSTEGGKFPGQVSDS
jgi:hypothetical protein